MKKTSLYTVSTLLIVTLVLLIIPFKRQKKYEATIDCSTDAVTRLMVNTKEWKKWWPDQILNDSIVLLNDTRFYVQTVLLNGFYAVSDNKKTAIEVQFVPDLKNQTKLVVIGTQVYSSNPLKRIAQLFGSNAQQNAKQLLSSLQNFFSRTENVYGFKIEKTKVSLLNWMSAKKLFAQQPTTQEIYAVIEGLEKYILAHNGEIIGAPIMHIRDLAPNQLELMTALPVTETVQPNEQYSVKQMVPGFMIIGKVKGGPTTVENAEASLENYIRDYRKQSPAIPFQTLITDRRKEADSSQWITQVNYPVFD